MVIDTRKQRFNNQRGVLFARQDLKLDSADLDNSRGSIAALGKLRLSSGAINNERGQLQSKGAMQVEVSAGEMDSFEDPIVPDHWRLAGSEKIKEFMQLFNDLIEERRVDPPFGQEILMGPKLRDLGWRFFLYSRGKREVVLISGDRGLTVMKRVLPKGSVIAAIYTFLNSEEFLPLSDPKRSDS
ncbi:hypothetical protein FEE59_22810 [Herbaspirillum sp. RU 5E]|nr:hypothetical protein [Herbaspirillum sp. RU 5E]